MTIYMIMIMTIGGLLVISTLVCAAMDKHKLASYFLFMFFTFTLGCGLDNKHHESYSISSGIKEYYLKETGERSIRYTRGVQDILDNKVLYDERELLNEKQMDVNELRDKIKDKEVQRALREVLEKFQNEILLDAFGQLNETDKGVLKQNNVLPETEEYGPRL